MLSYLLNFLSVTVFMQAMGKSISLLFYCHVMFATFLCVLRVRFLPRCMECRRGRAM